MSIFAGWDEEEEEEPTGSIFSGFQGGQDQSLIQSALAGESVPGLLRTEDVAGYGDLEDPGGWEMTKASAMEGFAAPFVGLAERFGLVPEGTRQVIRDDFEETRLDYLAANPTAGRTAWAGLTEFGATVAPIGVPAGTAGRLAARLGATGAKARAIGAGIGAAEGAALGFGETAGQGAPATALGLGLGALAGGVGGALGTKALPDVPEDIRPVLRSLEPTREGEGRARAAWRRWTSSAGELSPETYRRIELADGEIKATMVKAQATERALQDAVGAYGREGGDVAEVLELVDGAIKAKPFGLPEAGAQSTYRQVLKETDENIYNAAMDMRQHIDDMSQSYLDSGLLQDTIRADLGRLANRHNADPNELGILIEEALATGAVDELPAFLQNSRALRYMQLENIIEDNIGSYVHRSYRAFDDPKYLDKLLKTEEGQAAWREARAWMKKTMGPDVDDQQIMARMLNMADQRYDPIKMAGSGKVRPTERNVLRARKDLPIEVRKLLGEYDDPYLNYRKTVSLLATDSANHKMLRDVREDLIQSGLGVVGNPTGRFRHKITGDERKIPLAGLEEHDAIYTTKEIADVINGDVNVARWGGLSTFNGLVHLAKTGFSHPTHLRNFMSGVWMNLAQGHMPFRPRDLGQALDAAWYGATGKTASDTSRAVRRLDAGMDVDPTRAQQLYDELAAANIVQSGTAQGDLTHYLRLQDSVMQGRKPNTGLRKVGDYMTTAYQAEDDFWKTYLYSKEIDRLVGAGVDEAVAKKYAQNVVLDTMQIYSRIPKAVRMVRDFPLAGPFISFPAEIVRNLKNTALRGYREAMFPEKVAAELGEAGNERLIRALQSQGKKRITGLVATTMVMPEAFRQIGQQLSGTDTEQEMALREFMAPWNRNSQVMMLSHDPETQQYTFVDGSFTDPYNYAKRPLMAVVRAMADPQVDATEGLKMSFQEAADPFMGPEIWVSEAARAIRRYENQPGMWDEASLAGRVLMKSIEPGSLAALKRLGASTGLFEEILPSKSPWGTERKLFDETLGQFGVRLTTIDVPRAFEWKANDFRKTYSATTMAVNRQSGQDPFRQAQAANQAMANWRASAEQFITSIEQARKLGMTDQQIYQSMRAKKIKEEDAIYLMQGKVPPRSFGE